MLTAFFVSGVLAAAAATFFVDHDLHTPQPAFVAAELDVAGAAVPPPANRASVQLPQHVAHRGAADLAPELTAAAFAKALQYEPDFVEVDVQLTADSVPVLVHDVDLDRVSDVAAVYPGREHDPVGTFTLDELRALDFGSKFDSSFAGESVATLAELIDHLHPHDVGVFIELKQPHRNPGLEAAVSKVLDSDPRWQSMLAEQLVYFISFDADSLHRIAQRKPDSALMWLTSQAPDDDGLAEVAQWSTVVGVDHQNVDNADLQRIRDAEIDVALWTVNAKEDLERAIADRVDYVVTDRSDLLHDLSAKAAE